MSGRETRAGGAARGSRARRATAAAAGSAEPAPGEEELGSGGESVEEEIEVRAEGARTPPHPSPGESRAGEAHEEAAAEPEAVKSHAPAKTAARRTRPPTASDALRALLHLRRRLWRMAAPATRY
eukprot:SAG22_NODE_121_length_19129_cov_36.644614_10_plen_125_part_00